MLHTRIRSAKRSFALGQIALEVSASREDETPIDEAGLDALLSAFSVVVNKDIPGFTSRISGAELNAGETKHESMRTMTMGGTTLRAELTLTVDREVPEYVLAEIVNDILNKMSPYMIVVLDFRALGSLLMKYVRAVSMEAFNSLGAGLFSGLFDSSVPERDDPTEETTVE